MEAPDLVSGIEQIIEKRVEKPYNTASFITNDKSITIQEVKKEEIPAPKKKGFFGKLGSAVSSGLNSAKAKAEILGTKIKDLGIKDKTIEITKKAVDKTKAAYVES